MINRQKGRELGNERAGISDRSGLMHVRNGNGSAVNVTIDCLLVAGDRDRNRNVAPVDVLAAIRLAVRGECSPEVDVSNDGQVTSLDALMILKTADGRIAL